MPPNPSDETARPVADGMETGGPEKGGPKRGSQGKGGDGEAEAEPRRAADPEDIEEIGGPKGPEPTRYGDWEKGGRCSDF